MNTGTFTQEELDRQNRIEIAFGIKIEMVAPGLFEMIGYRKRVAQELMKSTPNSKRQEELECVLNDVNDNIKKLLGL